MKDTHVMKPYIVMSTNKKVKQDRTWFMMSDEVDRSVSDRMIRTGLSEELTLEARSD